MTLLGDRPPVAPFPQVPSSGGAVQLVHSLSCLLTCWLGSSGWSPGMFILRHPVSVSFLKKKKKIMLIKWTYHQSYHFNHFKAWISVVVHVFSVMRHHQCFGPGFFMTPRGSPRPCSPSPSPGDLCSVCVCSAVSDCDPTDCSPPGSSVHRILQARVLEQVAISSSRGSSWRRITGGNGAQGGNPGLLCLLHWQVGSLCTEAPGNPILTLHFPTLDIS